MDSKLKYIELLSSVQVCETIWAYYAQSGGGLYNSECRQAFIDVLDRIDVLKQTDGRFADFERLGYSDAGELAEFIDVTRAWSKDGAVSPFPTLIESRVMFYDFFKHVKAILEEELGFTATYAPMRIDQEFAFNESALRWKGYLPQIIRIWDKLGTILTEASHSNSIVVVGDIRRSQDLMTFARDAKLFSRYMGQFVTETRKHIADNFGFFDKFTGDGFIAYFNEFICKEFGMDYIDCFLKFCQAEDEFASGLFKEWRKTVRKSPREPIGLAIGADIGGVIFMDHENHLIAISDAIVWANRMVSIGKADEVVVNNLLITELQERSDVKIIPRDGATKAGETFMAGVIDFKKDQKENSED